MLEEPGRSAQLTDDTGILRSHLDLCHLMDLVTMPVIVVDPYYRVVSINGATEGFLGRQNAEVANTMVATLCYSSVSSQSSIENSIAEAVEACRSGVPRLMSLPMVTQNRGVVDCKCNLVPLNDPAGIFMGVMIAVREIGEMVAEDGPNGAFETPIQILAKTSTDMIENTDLAEIIEVEVGKLMDSLGLDFAIFRLLSPDDKPLMLCHGLDFKEARELLETKMADGSALYLNVCKGNSYLFADTSQYPNFDFPKPGPRSLVCITIHWSNKAYGCAFFGSRKPDVNVSMHFPVLQVFCNQVGISLRNAALYKELKSRNIELSSLYEVSRVLLGTLDYKEVMHTILVNAKRLVNAESCFIYELDPVRNRLKCISSVTDPPVNIEKLELAIGVGYTGIVAETDKGLLIERTDIDQRGSPIEGTANEPRSVISVPLQFSEKLIGVMTLSKKLGTPFVQKQYELIALFSLKAALAVHNASIYEKVRSYASSLQMYNVLLTHDVANFNVPIHGFLEMLLKDPKLDDRQRRYVRSALVQSDNISELISDVRELSRLRSKLGDQPLESVDMIPVIKEAKEDIFSNAVYEDIETTFETQMDTAVIMADAFLKDLFYNLLSNACKYGGGRPVEIKVSSTELEDIAYWKIRILDGGKGIPDERKATLFKRFDQLDTVQGSDGHGLGLSVVGALCDRYGGKVWVEDRVPGDYSKGSVFNVLLPIPVIASERTVQTNG